MDESSIRSCLDLAGQNATKAQDRHLSETMRQMHASLAQAYATMALVVLKLEEKEEA